MRRPDIKYVMNTKKYSGCFSQWFGTSTCTVYRNVLNEPPIPPFYRLCVYLCKYACEMVERTSVRFLVEDALSNLVHTLGRRTTPIFRFRQWCSTRLRLHVHRDFYRSCVRLPPGNCSCEVCLLTTSDTPFQKSSLLLLPCNLYQLYHPRRNSDILVKYVV